MPPTSPIRSLHPAPWEVRTTDPAAALAARHHDAERRRVLAVATPSPLTGARRAFAARLRELAERLERRVPSSPLPERGA